MTGSAFIVHNDTWSCSNEVLLGIYSDPVYDDKGGISSIRETKTLTIDGIFHATIAPNVGDRCEIVMLSDDKRYAFIGNIRSISPLKTVLNIFTKSDRIKEILSNITFKF